MLPPIEAIFADGSEAVEAWLEENEWDRSDRWNENFADPVAAEYVDLWMANYPLYFATPPYAVLGGWHFLGPDTIGWI